MRRLADRWLAPVLFVAALIAYQAWYMTPGLFRAWFQSSDEYVIVAEVIRFLHLDFRQQFFDMPGTPLMLLSALLWAGGYSIEWMAGLVPRGAGLEQFTFAHLPQLFTLMRSETLIFAFCSIILVFILASKLTNRAGACVAALMLMMSPTYNTYSSLIRVESFSVCLVLAATLAMLHAIDIQEATAPREQRWILIAGLLAGLGAAVRLHSIIASLPLLLMLLLFRSKASPPYAQWMASLWKYALGLVFAAAVATVIGIRTGYLPGTNAGRGLTALWPNAFRALNFVFLAIAASILIASTLPGLARRVLHPRVMVLMAGCSAGFLLGTPTILWQYRYMIQSINMYTVTYIDHERMNWPVFKNVKWFLNFYLDSIALEPLSLALLGIGVLLILIRRDWRLVPFLIAGALFFVSKPINLVAAKHHILPWLPFYCIIAGYAAAQAYDALPDGFLKRGALTALLIGLFLTMIPGPKTTAATVVLIEKRTQNVTLASDWIHKSTPSDSVVAISFFCFDPDIFYTWLRSLQVPVPKSTEDGRHYLIWWGERSALKGLSGFACAMPRDLEAIKRRMDLASRREGTDPFSETGFKRVAVFGEQPNEVDVFRFDFGDRR